MNLTELSVQYREAGEQCRLCLRGQQLALREQPMGEAERALTRRRITLLTAMLRECISTSIYLKNYYRRHEA